jgi:hypothetical protein
VTEHPTAAWTAQQIVEAFPDDPPPAYLLRDFRTTIYGLAFRQRVKGMRILEVLTAAHRPWPTPFVERLIGSVRRECLDHVLVLNERHLRRILAGDFADYHRARPHLSLEKDTPDGRPIEGPEAGSHRTDSRSRGPASSRRPAGGLISHHPASPAHQLATPGTVRPLAVPPSQPELHPVEALWSQAADCPAFHPLAIVS